LILVADDDEEDRLLIEEAFVQNGLFGHTHFVEDGEDAIAFLKNCLCKGETLPSLIMLDVNMPRKSGLETLQVIRATPKLKHLPVLMMTSSRREIEHSYDLGANSYLVKPVLFNDLIQMLGEVTAYWRDTVSLPTDLAD